MSIIEVPLVATYRAIAGRATTRDANETLEEVQHLRSRADEDATAHSAAVETAFREQLIELIATLDIEQDDFTPIWSLLDALNLLCDNEMCESPFIFYLIEDLLDSQTIQGCRRVFKYLESRREAMTKVNFAQKNLTILRWCNGLLRRLSRAEDTVFCGRVFIYLFQCFPLGDKSSVNLRGEFHVENITTYDGSATSENEHVMDVDTADHAGQDGVESTSHLNELYPLFWSLQTLFSSPTKLFESQSMAMLKDAINSTIATFSTVAKDMPGTSSTNEEKRGVKRKIDGTNFESSELDSSTFNPKYLTNRHLFDLEIHDIEFRRHILVQSLVLLDFLLSLSAQSKTKLASLSQGKGIMSTLYDKYTLSEDDKNWCSETRRNIERCLETDGNGTEGRMFVRMVNMVLSRDRNWALWKVKGCSPITAPAVTNEVTAGSANELLKLNNLATRPLAKPKGAEQLSFLSHTEGIDVLRENLLEPPSLEKYYNDIGTLDLDLDFAADEEKKEINEQKAGKLWRALRSANGKRFALCEEIKNGENLGALIGKQEETVPVNGDIAQPEKEDLNNGEQPEDQAVKVEKVDTPMTTDTIGGDAVEDASEVVENNEIEAPT